MSKANENPFTNRRMPLSLRLFFSFMRVVFKVLGVISPKLAGKLALRFFMTPPKITAPRREHAVRDSATLKHQPIKHYKIAVRSWGEGPVVLLSHGWGGRGTQFFALIEALVAAGYRVVAVDAPAHGDSTGKRTNMMDVSEILAEVAKQEGPIEALIGHSFGSGTALLAIEWHQLPVKKVVLYGCFADVIWITESFGKVFGMSKKVTAAMRTEALIQYKDAYASPWQWDQLSPVETIKSYSGELLLFHDEQDYEVPYAHSQQLDKIADNAKLITTTKLGHRKILADKDCIQQCLEFMSD